MGDKKNIKNQSSNLSRRDFLKLSGLSLSIPLLTSPRIIKVAGEEVKVFGPGKVPITLLINGETYSANIEPRVTLLDVLRQEFDLTGAKPVCDNGTCGACTILLDGRPVYACMILAVDVQEKQITTIEGLTPGNKLNPIQQAFVDNDAQQCGFCTPGFVVATQALLDKNPNPSPEQIQKELGGNLCRCGTYMGIRAAVKQVAKG